MCCVDSYAQHMSYSTFGGIIAERSEANNRAVCDLGWRMYIYIYIYICKCGPGPRGSPRQQCAVVRGSIRLIERPACARSRL